MPANTIDDIRHAVGQAFVTRYPQTGPSNVRMVGLLFAPPNSHVAKTEIVPRLDEFHHRSGNHIDFFCAGYGAYWPWSHVPDKKVVATVTSEFGNEREWLFSAAMFNNIRKQLKVAAPQYVYSGESDLLLFNAYPAPNSIAALDFTDAIALKLSNMRNDKLLDSVAELFEQIFTYSERQSGVDPTWGFSDAMGWNTGKSWAKELILSALPVRTERLWRLGRHYAVLNLSSRRQLLLKQRR